MSNSTANHVSISLPRPCPLAFDETGKPIPIPPEAAFWRVRRHTAGRPRVVVGADRQPLKLPLDYSADELLYLVGRGSYRLDLCDETGESLETVAVTVGEPEPELRNAAEDSSAISPMLPSTGNEVRLVLEANVRATQMAFQHNERTLAASLKMAETLRDGVHVLAESQAEWIKSIANARGLFRNAAPPPPPPEPAATEDDSEDDDDGGNGPLLAFGAEVVKLVNNLVANRPASATADKGTKQLKAGTGFDWRALLDWRKAAPTQDSTEADKPKATATLMSPADMLRVYSSLPDELRTKLDAVRIQFSPKEQAQLMSTLSVLDQEHIAAIADELAPLTADEIVARIRKQLGTKGAQ